MTDEPRAEIVTKKKIKKNKNMTKISKKRKRTSENDGCAGSHQK